jgi:hypothetical protein
MDFMVSLPPSKGFDAIMVVVDRFNKMAHFIPTKDEARAQEIGKLFFSHIFKHYGFPKDIVLDQNPKFTSKFWRALWKRMGSEVKMSTSFRPQTCRAPKFLVDPLEGPSMRQCGRSWNLEHDPDFQH